MNYTGKNGYTLIELLVGLTIIGMLFGYGFISFREYSRRQAIASAGKTVIGDLRIVQEMATSGKKPSDAKCNLPQTLIGYGIVFASDSYTSYAYCSGGNVAIKSVDVPNDITITAPATNPIIFKVLGEGTNIASGVTVTITLTQAVTGNTHVVSVGYSGDIK